MKTLFHAFAVNSDSSFEYVLALSFASICLHLAEKGYEKITENADESFSAGMGVTFSKYIKSEFPEFTPDSVDLVVVHMRENLLSY